MREHVQAPPSRSTRRDVSPGEARERFAAEGQDYKVELIDDLVAQAEAGHPPRSLDSVSLYTNGPFTDLCRGPHAPSTKSVGAFKLQSVAGAYWRGDSDRTMLTRIYGTAFFTDVRTAAAPRAHRAGPGARPPQARTRARPVHVLRAVAREPLLEARRDGDLERAHRPVAQRERQPAATARSRRRSCTTSSCGSSRATGTSTGTTCTSPTSRIARWALKPMNCPAHIQIYKDERHSYRDLPMRYCEAGPGASPRAQRGAARAAARAPHHPGRRPHLLHRGAGQQEVVQCLRFGFDLYRLFGFEPRLELSTRPEQRIGSDEMWDRAEAALARRARRRGPGVRAEPRRRRLLRPEDRPAHDRLARALVAAGHGAARLLDARALRAAATRAPTTPSTGR